MHLLTGNYWSKSYLSSVEETKNMPAVYERPDDLNKDVSFSTKWGVGFVDAKDQNKDNVILVEYIAPQSPFQYMIDDSIKDKTVTMKAETGYQVEKLVYVNEHGTKMSAGKLFGQNASQLTTILDQKAQQISQVFFKTPGGGIKGSIISTIWLIIISMLIALPLGVASAIYLHEYAPKNRLTALIRSAIEMLTGVPSIIFGLMGVVVLFPIYC